MIVKEYENKYELIRQHDHGLLSGEMAFHSGNLPFVTADFRMILTASLHDISWISADNDPSYSLYQFHDYPLPARLALYKKGIDRMESADPYVALLTSLHYTAFFQPGNEKMIDHFLEQETNRQAKLKKMFPNENIELALQHLKMWDNLSLYVCLNKAGTTKENEHPWYKNGIKCVTASGDEIMIHGRWQDKQTVTFSPFPFKKAWSTVITSYECQKPFHGNYPLQKKIQKTITFTPDE